ncbi:polyprenyl synthetase family protein [Nocardiopsis dassonvillei]|uniref:Polyprenyl synthetase n=1 Tax=Nocardiopsis dassonvillei (strain ATCC 23218 / DSM 43111 / CIP 107115 / JCM 7437 / KCTC 9190 / NBRC 14626 / NCTC 10488 / NRRL B-5397 / IMRU 509) TaxID=446468 RepID=D7B4I0_NOCDD|nr:polyprenyl synthetase family protein [Nocardiopsis dassonvillei]ADH68975.1 Polyprenyl synthetase [Nocardiopsis dassonvillei subsp. dassonvillei DSM 43111]NKY81887.1 polyprenyl synthetase family protein [Nocardiopsis dassonvillei]VEI89484.1 Farnesyl diphosphate synthase [Nocardiopsis dassonvillei]
MLPGEDTVNPILNTHRHPRPPDAEDADERSALEASLKDYLERRLRDSEDLDGDFGRDLAGTTVRFTLGGGKRMRPLLAWWGWLAGGGAPSGETARAARQACAAVELVQTCALVHDDVMDGSPTRRGRPSVHAAHALEHERDGHVGDSRRYGEALAVLVGDLALVWADDMLNEALPGVPEPVRARAVWRDLRTEIMAGQFLDVRAQARRERSEEAALRVDLLKTASYSVERPLHLGAAMAGADPAAVGALRGYGRDVGIAFQLRDDLLGVYGDSSRTGKPVGEDIREGKCTLLLVIGTRLARERGDDAALRLLDRIGLPGEDVDPAEAADALDRLGARDLVGARCRELAERGRAHLEGLDAPAHVLEGLGGLASRIARDRV